MINEPERMNYMKIIEIAENQEIKIKKNSDGSQTIEIYDKYAEKLKNLNPGERFKIADWTFIVLRHDERGTLVISNDLLAKNVEFGETRNYKESNVRKVIENDILPVVENRIGKDNIIEHCVDLTSVDMQNEFGDVRCRMRPISFDEAREYNNLLVNKELDDWYWTLTPWSTKERGRLSSLAVVSPAGGIHNGCYFNGRGVRPCCILNSNIFVSERE